MLPARSPQGRFRRSRGTSARQTLGMTQDKMQNDASRRSKAAHLAYGEGMLVCPTNAGAIFGVNLLENSLVWAYPYRDKKRLNADGTEYRMVFAAGMASRRALAMGPDGQLYPIRHAESVESLRSRSSRTARLSSPPPMPAPFIASTSATARPSGLAEARTTICTSATSTTARC